MVAKSFFAGHEELSFERNLNYADECCRKIQKIVKNEKIFLQEEVKNPF